jgi:hypothetical protein
MRVLGILTLSQEDQGMRLVEVMPKIYELRDFETLVIAYAGFVDKKQSIKDADEYLRRKHAREQHQGSF